MLKRTVFMATLLLHLHTETRQDRTRVYEALQLSPTNHLRNSKVLSFSSSFPRLPERSHGAAGSLLLCGAGAVLTWLRSSAQGRFPEQSPHVLCCAHSLFSPERLKSQVHLFYFPILRLLQMFAGKHQCQSIFWSLSMILRIPVLYILYSESRGNAGAHLKGKPGIL